MAIIGINGKISSGKDTVGQIIQYLVCESKDTLAPYQKFEDLVKQIQEFGLAPISNKIQSGWEIKKFAGKLKEIAALLTGCTIEQLEDQEFKKLDVGPDWGMTYRELLQKLGTEAMRNGLHTNVWVNALMADYHIASNKSMDESFKEQFLTGRSEIHYKFPNWIITDMRFPNELEAIKAKDGITIRVNRNSYPTERDDIKLTQRAETFLSGNIPEHESETALDDAKFDYVIDNNGTIEDLIQKVKVILVKEDII